MVPREIKDNAYAKCQEANKVYYGRCANGKLTGNLEGISFSTKANFTVVFIAILEHSGSNSSYEKQCDILKLMIHSPVIVSTGTSLLSGEKGQILGRG